MEMRAKWAMTRLSLWDLFYAVDMSIACAISYWVMTQVVSQIGSKESGLLGGMWATVATVFVFRDTQKTAWSAGIARLTATIVSFVLCLVYLWFLPFTVVGMAALIALGSLAMMLLNRRDDIVITGITTVVVMVVAALSPQDAWQQPFLRMVDTVVGIGVGIACKWLASFVYFRIADEPVR
jgi:uncharacterized membrane protein YccC